MEAPETVDHPGEPLPPVHVAYHCGPHRMIGTAVRCGAAIIPAGPPGTDSMHISCAGTDAEVLMMAVAMVDYVHSLGLEDAFCAALASGVGRDRTNVVRSAMYDAPNPDEETP